MNKKYYYRAALLLGLLVIVLLVSVLTEHFKTTSSNGETGPIKIGVATLLTGDYAELGQNIVNAAQLTVSEINAAGGINGRPIQLFIEDSKVDSEDGLNAVQKLINVDGVSYIIAGMSSNGTLAAAPLANQDHVIMMTPVTGGKNVDEAGPYVFRTANSDILSGTDLSDAMIKLGYKNVAVIAEVTDYTVDVETTFKNEIAAKGGTVVDSEEFQSDTTDYRTMIAKIKAADPQAILVLSQTGTDAAYFIVQSRQLGLHAPLFSDFNLVTNSNVKTIVGSLDGIYFADPSYDTSDPATLAFFQKYQDMYHEASAIPFHAADTYDDLMLLAQAIRAVGDNSVSVQQWLSTKVQNYHGLMGTYSLDANGNSNLGFTIRIIKNDQPADVQL